MKAAVVFKWAVDPKDIRVNSDGSMDWSTVSAWVGDDDYAAVQVGCSAAGSDGEVIGLTLAGGDVAFAAARGAQKTIAVQGISVEADSWIVAQALAEAIRKIGDVDVVSIGDCAWEPEVPAMLAGILGWPALMAVDSVKEKEDGLSVIRCFGVTTQEVSVKTPVVLGVAAKREEENKPGMRAVITARKKPVETWNINELLKESVPAFVSRKTMLPEREPSKIFDGTNPEQAVEQLLQSLQAEGAL